MRYSVGLVCLLCTVGVATEISAEDKKVVIPHAQDKPPNEPRDPQTAAKMMTVPEGFSVEVVAAEPDIVNPVAMTIDERGRFWITESLEYPRKSAGPGKDRIKILEDTDGDGKCDKFTVFLDGLNIPSGIAVGHGGVWIANSPDILFVPDANRDGKPDGPPQVVVTGFGRTDTHELPNSLTWGPDGWLYGLNGVFNYSKVTYPPDSPWLKHVAESNVAESLRDSAASRGATRPQTEFTFTCAMFRIHPRTREFQIFAEGTSNPWGIAFNDEGEAFVSACVIDHLWHIVETGYYHRQGGPYPPFTWKIDSIVKHKHQKAAYCGIHYFDSDAYPEQYRGKLYMGNIHGGCINVDKLQRDGSTYFATGEPDFLTANDAWFMPVVQKTGPDGCLYILDWYDRYHCYQDANRDPAGIDRLKGRFYRVRYNGKPNPGERGGVSPLVPPVDPSKTNADKKEKPAGLRQAARQDKRLYPQMDLAKETDEQLIERLGANNDFIRWTATRLLQERATPTVVTALRKLVEPPSVLKSFFGGAKATKPLSRTTQLQVLFALAGIQNTGDAAWWESLLKDKDETVRAWAVRSLLKDPGLNNPRAIAEFQRLVVRIMILTGDAAPVRLQTAIAMNSVPPTPRFVSNQFDTWLLVLEGELGEDKLLSHIAWQNLHPRLEEHADQFLNNLEAGGYLRSHNPAIENLMPRVIDRLIGRLKFDAKPIAKLFALLRDHPRGVGRQVLEVISAKVQSGELKGEKLDQLKAALAEQLTPLLADGATHPLGGDAALLAVSWGDPRGLPQVRRSFATRDVQPDLRLKALNALISAKDAELLDNVAKVLDDTCEMIANCKLQIANLKLKKEDSQPISNFQFAICNLQSQLLPTLGRVDDPKVADIVLSRYQNLEPELQPSAIELLTQRANWSKQLLARVADKKIAATAINVNQARRIQALKDKELSDLLSRHWGQVRDTRNPDREKVVAEMKSLIRQQPGDPFAGEKVFKRVCAACHKIYGEGPDIGPDITSNGRNDFNQLLSNVFDPSLVIGAGYRVCTVVNKAGRVQSGLLVEDSPQRVVLKPAVAGSLGLRPEPDGKDSSKAKSVGTESQPTVTVTVGKLEIIPREDIDEFKINELSLMPEGLEKQLTPQEITDLFAFLTLDKHPKDPNAKQLPGVREPLR